MASKSSSTETFVIEGAILSYPHLFKAQQVMGQGEAKFSCALLVSEAAAQEVYAKAQQLAASHFQNNEAAMPNFAWPIVAANTKQNYVNNPRLASLYVINAKASADYPPQIVDGNRQPVIDRGQVYAGCIVAAGVRLYTYNNMGNIGVGVGLAAIMKTGDGEALGGEAVDASTLFGGVQAQTPTAAPMGMPGGAPAPLPGAAPVEHAPADNNMPSEPFPAGNASVGNVPPRFMTPQ